MISTLFRLIHRFIVSRSSEISHNFIESFHSNLGGKFFATQKNPENWLGRPRNSSEGERFEKASTTSTEDETRPVGQVWWSRADLYIRFFHTRIRDQWTDFSARKDPIGDIVHTFECERWKRPEIWATSCRCCRCVNESSFFYFNIFFRDTRLSQNEYFTMLSHR